MIDAFCHILPPRYEETRWARAGSKDFAASSPAHLQYVRFAIGQATATLSAVGLSTIAGRLISGYLLDRFFAPYVAAALFLLALAGVGILAAGAGDPALLLSAIALGFGLGAEVDVIGFMVSRYFGLRSYGAIYGCLFAIFTVGTGLGPVLMGLSFDQTHSYRLALAVFGVALVCASVVVSRLGRYNFPARHQA
jgi:MFS family permease